jgi:hypothetical protein
VEVAGLSEGTIPAEAAPLEQGQVAGSSDPAGVQATGEVSDDRIAIYKHSLCSAGQDRYDPNIAIAGVELAIRNISELGVGTAVFEGRFYDREGNLLNTVRHKELDLPPRTSRAIVVNSQLPMYEVASYDVALVRLTTVDHEKLQICRAEIIRKPAGGKLATGSVKNISTATLNAAIVASFYDLEKQNIGVRVLVLRNVEPGGIRKYEILFTPQEGDEVASTNVIVGEATLQ